MPPAVRAPKTNANHTKSQVSSLERNTKINKDYMK